jgi:hypothetical protein
MVEKTLHIISPVNLNLYYNTLYIYIYIYIVDFKINSINWDSCIFMGANIPVPGRGHESLDSDKLIHSV